MKYFLTEDCVLKWLENPSVYHLGHDDLYELDDLSFAFLRKCASDGGCSAEQTEFIRYCLHEGILTKDRLTTMKHPALIKSPVPSLRYLELQITDRCNLRCRHCYIGDTNVSVGRGKHRKKELTVTQIKKILKEFEEMQGLRVLVSGGEPLIHSRFGMINDMLPGFSVRKVLFTNGLLLTRATLKTLHVDEIQVSIDGLQNAHDSLRGQGSYEAALKAVHMALDSGFEVSISTMVHPGNLNDFDTLETLFKKIGIRDWTVDVPCVTGRLKEHEQFAISPEEGGKYLGYGFGEGLHSGSSGFGCGLHLMAIMADGNAAKCTFYAESPVGNIQDGLRKCWQRIPPVRLADLKCDCGHLELCRGGCRYRAALLGNPCGRDLYKCKMYDIM